MDNNHSLRPLLSLLYRYKEIQSSKTLPIIDVLPTPKGGGFWESSSVMPAKTQVLHTSPDTQIRVCSLDNALPKGSFFMRLRDFLTLPARYSSLRCGLCHGAHGSSDIPILEQICLSRLCFENHSQNKAGWTGTTCRF